MSKSRIVQNSDFINQSSVYKEWKDKVQRKVSDNLMSNEQYPSESLVIHWASVIIFDYHDTVDNGRLGPDNRNPNEDDLDLFTRIIITIYYCPLKLFDSTKN